MPATKTSTRVRPSKRPRATRVSQRLPQLLREVGTLLQSISEPLYAAREAQTQSKPRLYGPLATAMALLYHDINDLPEAARRVSYKDLVQRIRDAAGWSPEDTAPRAKNGPAWSVAKSVLSRSHSVLEWLYQADRKRAMTVVSAWIRGRHERHPLQALYQEYQKSRAGTPIFLEARVRRVLEEFIVQGGNPETVMALMETIPYRPPPKK